MRLKKGARMSSMFSIGKETVASIFCDIQSTFIATEQIFHDSGLEWPDDFDAATDIGNSRFQVTRDFKSGACLINHEGILSPFTERKILLRQHKVRKTSVTKRVGHLTPFWAENVFLLETGFNMGDVEYLVFDLRKKKQVAFDSYRAIAFSFPLFWLLNEVVALEETKLRKGLDDNRVQELENDRILKNPKLVGWDFTDRDISPSEDAYREVVERPLHDFSFKKGDHVGIRLKFEFFSS
jgi:hypothetical protein